MRDGCVILALLTLAAAWVGPLPVLARDAFFAHMIIHMAVVAVAAPLLAFGVAGRRFDPAARSPRLFAPVQASLAELVIVWAWHTPALHEAARHQTAAFVAEQWMFFTAAFWLWVAALGGERSSMKQRSAAGVAALLLTAMHMTLLGALLALSPRPLYTHLAENRTLAPLDDQHLGGAIMLLVGGASYLLGGLWLTARLLRAPVMASLERS